MEGSMRWREKIGKPTFPDGTNRSSMRFNSVFMEFMSVTVSDRNFPAPVRVKSSERSSIISTAWDAVEYLKKWPATRGREYRIAFQHCLDALDGLRSPRSAQASFVRAARIAGLLV